MMWQYTPYALPMFIAAAISAGFASYAWRRRNAPGLTAFSLLMLAVAEWSLGYGLELGGVDLPTKILWAKIEYVGIVSLPLAWLIFALQYSGRGRWLVRRRRLVAGLAVAPLITLSLVFTNEAHGLIWRQTRLEASGPFLAMAVDYGPWFWVNFAIAYLWLLSGTLVLIHRLVRSPQLYRNQAGVLLAGALVPWAGNALYVAGLSPIPQLDLTPLTFTLSGLIIGWGIFRFRLLDIMPIARNAVIESMSDGVIVVDTQNRIVDLNPAAQRMIDRPAARAIGQPLGQVFSDRSELIKRCYDETEARTEFALDEDGLKRYYELRISPLRHKRDRLIGRLIVLRDVTEQRQAIQKQRDAEAKYQRLIEQLPAISYIVTFGEVNRTTYISPQVESFLGFTPEEWLADPDLWIKLLHPDDRERVLSEVRQRDASAEPLVLEYRTLDRAGRVLWVYNRSTLVLDESGQPLYSQGVIFDITERKRAEEAERDQRVLAEALRDTALALNSTLDFDEVLERILTNVGRVVPHDAANVMLIDQGLAYIVRHRGYVERGLAEYAQSLRLSTVDAPNLRYMIDNVQPLVIPDVRSYEGWIRLPEMSWQRSYLGAPIALEGEVIGFLNLDSTTPGTFTADHAERLQAFAAQAGVAIGNARLYDELRRRATELELQVAERRRAEAELRRQGRLLEGVARATNLLLTNRNHIAAIDQALAVLGRAAGVDRVRVFENHPHPLSGEPATSQRFEWTREPEEAQIDDPAVQNVPWRAPILSRWQRLLAKGRSLGGLVRKFPARERRVLEAQGLLSLLVMPIIIGDEFWGFIGFDDCHAERLWSQEDKSTLRTMAGSIGGALARQRAEEALARARDQALEATRIKSQFLANMSHEIRTPMNAVIGFTSVLLDTDLTAEQRDFLNSIRTSGNALLTIINDILDFSKIEASRLEMESQPFDLRACLQEAFDLVAAEAEKKGLDLSFDVEDRVPPVLVGDTTRLRQILVNLLNNAVKFTETGRVSVSVSGVEVSGDHVSGDHVSSVRTNVTRDTLTRDTLTRDTSTPDTLYEVHFAISDTGIGIPPDRLDRLFQSFSQVDASTTRKYGGTGLGLAISKRLVELMGGQMWVESQEGVGSTFHFTIVAQAGPDRAILPARTQPPQPESPPPANRQLRILLAEDNAVNQKVALRLLERLGYRADLAGNGLEALEALKRQSYDVVLMDVQMPEMDGLEASRRICREWPEGARPRIIAMTANAMQGDREMCLAAGMDDYISKPVHLEELSRALGQCQPPNGLSGPARPESAPVASIDAAVLGEFREMMGEDAGELIDLFLADAPALVSDLKQALAQDDPEALRRAAHTLKSSSATFGALVLSEMCREVEEIGRSGAVNGVGPQIAAIEAEFEAARAALKRECQPC